VSTRDGIMVQVVLNVGQLPPPGNAWYRFDEPSSFQTNLALKVLPEDVTAVIVCYPTVLWPYAGNTTDRHIVSRRRQCQPSLYLPANRGAPVRFGAHLGRKRNEKYDNNQRQRQGERRPSESVGPAIAAAAGVLEAESKAESVSESRWPGTHGSREGLPLNKHVRTARPPAKPVARSAAGPGSFPAVSAGATAGSFPAGSAAVTVSFPAGSAAAPPSRPPTQRAGRESQ
jgi:hypothetical protein